MLIQRPLKSTISVAIAIGLSLTAHTSYCQGINGFFSPLRTKLRQPPPFSHPRRVIGDTVYVLNGKQTTNAQYVKSVLSDTTLTIDTVVSGQLTRQGALETIIHYRKRP